MYRPIAVPTKGSPESPRQERRAPNAGLSKGLEQYKIHDTILVRSRAGVLENRNNTVVIFLLYEHHPIAAGQEQALTRWCSWEGPQRPAQFDGLKGGGIRRHICVEKCTQNCAANLSSESRGTASVSDSMVLRDSLPSMIWCDCPCLPPPSTTR
jgi:hypothetical protein